MLLLNELRRELFSRIRPDAAKKLSDRRAEELCESGQVVDARRPRTAFPVGHGRRTQVESRGNLALRQVRRAAQLPQAPSQLLADRN